MYHQVCNVDVDEFGQKLARAAVNVIQHSAVERMLEQRQYVEEVVQLGFNVRTVRPGPHVLVGVQTFDLVHGTHVDGRER